MERINAMFHLRFALAGAASLAFASAAQPATASPPPSSNATAVTDQGPPAPSAASRGVNTSVTVDSDGARHLLISNPPVQDTPQNRAKYGAPLSRAGKHTPAAGN
jgi:hypothetical protein